MTDDVLRADVREPPPRSRGFRIGRVVFLTLMIGLIAPAALILAYRFMPVPGTPLMAFRAVNGAGWDYDWVPLERIAPALARSALTAEDESFCTHHGFDTKAIQKYLEDYLEDDGGTLRGGSTISQQTAKNLLLWPGRDWIRKGLEAWLTIYIEALWPKRRIMEVYLNIVEWGRGVYGAEAAARHHFGKSAAALTTTEAARLAAVLPSPLRWSASNPGPYVQRRSETLQARAARLGDLAACLKG
ncbi:MAG: monofunctional biosynthetic peptidoglycan transglycosylase [Rhodospirillaceae bacterium]